MNGWMDGWKVAASKDIGTAQTGPSLSGAGPSLSGAGVTEDSFSEGAAEGQHREG